MIVRDPEEFLALSSSERLPARSSATARAAFLVAPAGAALAAESATDNRYMDLAETLDPVRAYLQHAELARRLGEDVPVVTFPGDATCPDGMFPNNVFATARGRLIAPCPEQPASHRASERDTDRGDTQQHHPEPGEDRHHVTGRRRYGPEPDPCQPPFGENRVGEGE